MQGVSLALMGGGRWARVHAAVLRSLYPRIGRLLWVSHHNRGAVERAAVGSENPAVLFFDGIEEALRQQPDGAVVCTASANHARDALTILEHDIPVLVEKPVALDLQSARNLVAAAETRHLPLWICLPLLEASYLRRFKSACAGPAIASMQIRWFDVASETRYGEVKHTDFSTHYVDEVVPHIWSLIDLLLGPHEPQVIATALDGSGATRVQLRCGEADIQATFGRRAPKRQRCVWLSFADGAGAQLDFSHEPGVATIGDQPIADDGSWATDPRPLASLHASFLDSLNREKRLGTDQFRRCLHTVALAENIRDRVVAQDASRTAMLLRSGRTVRNDPALSHLLLDNLGPELASLGIRIGADEAEHRELCEAAEFALLPQSARLRAPASVFNDYRAALAASGFIRQVRCRLGR